MLLNEAISPLHELIIVAINTGLRVEAEALPLRWVRWVDVDFRRALLTVHYAEHPAQPASPGRLDRTETPRERRVRIQQAHEQLYDSMEKPLMTLVRKAGLAGTGVSLHTLRHTFANRLVQAGVDLRTVQELGGWSDLSMVQRYVHVGPSHKLEAVRRIADPFHYIVHCAGSEQKTEQSDHVTVSA